MSQFRLPFSFSWFARKRRKQADPEHRRSVQLWLFPSEQPTLPGVPLPAPEVVVECIRTGKSRLRVRRVADAYAPILYCSFPRELRQEGARYLVKQLHLMRPRRGCPYYRTAGEIRRMEDSHV